MADKALMLHFKMADLRALKKNLQREEPAYDLKSTTKWIMKQRKEHQMRFSFFKDLLNNVPDFLTNTFGDKNE